MQENIKVLVVDESAFMRKLISDVLSKDDEISVVGMARDGIEAIEKAKTLNPDVITLDIEMSLMKGLTCLKELLRDRYYSIVIMSSLTSEGEKATLVALENGAIDFITKPENVFNINKESKRNEIVKKVKIASGVRKKKNISSSNSRINHKRGVIEKDDIKINTVEKIVAIGASTGGPRALQDVIPLIPGGIPAAIVIVQHMPAGFTSSLALRLDSISDLNVKEAEDGDVLLPGYVYIAPGDYHMKFKKIGDGRIQIKLTHDLPVGGHRPSVNVMLETLSDTGFPNIMAVIMTGMGADGAEGIKKIKRKNNGYVIAQNEETSVVYGMPKMAYQTGMVDKVTSLKDISNEIMKFVGV